ncbi:MAG: beta-propeller domain-containing protein [Fuerstiella sp.]
MKFPRLNRRRQTSTRLAVNSASPALAIEQLERKQLLSATNGGQQDTNTADTDVDPDLQTFRNELLANTIALADSEYAELWGTETQQFWYLEYDTIAQAVSDQTLALRTSDTNVQVAGVDEADIVETDGTFIYTLSGSQLIIIRAATDDVPAEIVSQVTLESRPQSMFLTDGRLTVISSTDSHSTIYALSESTPATSTNQTRLTVFDISDASQPTVIDETIVDGQFDSARAVGNSVYLVVRNNRLSYLPDLNIVPIQNEFLATNLSFNWRYETRQEYVDRVTSITNERIPPSIYQRSTQDGPTQQFVRLGWLEEFNSSVSIQPEALVSVLKFDLEHLESGVEDVISHRTSSFGQTFTYATADALYLSSQQYQFATRITTFPLDVLRVADVPTTLIQKIDLTGDTLRIAATGTIPGAVESQFSLDEHNGYLRVVTTTGFGSSQNDWANHLFVLENVGTELIEVGSITDLAPTERIFSARFDGDRGWMVTFRQTDPVFSFDLSDPTNPVVTGELKIPGFSDYLQLIDDDHLLAIGRNATDEGRALEVQVSLFNIADPENPALLHRYSFDPTRWGASEASNNHLAFNYLPEDQILAIPFNMYNDFQLVMLNVDPVEGISLAGDIGENEPVDGSSEADKYQTPVRRSVQIGDRLYAISATHVQVIHLDSPDEVEASLHLEDAQLQRQTLIDLPWRFENPFEGDLRLREVVEENIDQQFVLSIISEAADFPDDISQFEFRILDPETGEELTRQVSEQPELLLSELPQLGNLDQVLVQARVLRERLANSNFTRWSEAINVTLSSAGEILSESRQQVGATVLEWSAIRDRVESATNQGETVAQLLQSYEVWISDADLMQRIALHTDLTDTQLPLDLDPGQYFTWVRGVFADGTKGEWSARENLNVLAQAPQLLTQAIATASNELNFDWEAASSLVQFEVQVISTDGTETIYTPNSFSQTSFQLIDELQPGQYSVRVRGFTANDRPSEWSDAVSVTIDERPELNLTDGQLSWAPGAADQFEIWVANAANERVFHTVAWHEPLISNVIADLNLGQQAAGQIKVWVRSVMPDGSKTAWSAPETIYHQIPDQIVIETASLFGLSELPVIQWQAAPAVDSFEVFIKRVGEAGAFLRQDGLTETAFTLGDQVPAGEYQLWVRGALTGGGFTSWGDAHHFSVADSPVLSIVDNVASWTSELDTDRFELWVNRYDEFGELLETRALHNTEIVDNTFDLSSLEEGTYGVWIRSVLDDSGDGEVHSAWSSRANVVIDRGSDLLDDVVDVIDDIIGDAIGDLDLF